MTGLVAWAALVWLGWLLLEAHRVRAARAKLCHVVHVNGTRGKSTVSRLIAAGLRAGGVRAFCKTTGTDPVTIDTEGREEPILRRGRPNIREQIGILCRAADQGAQVLVAECMAVRPELQHAAQHDILRADVGVITNVRRDHTDVMGESLPQICASLCNTVPRNGVLFTGEEKLAGQIERAAKRLGSEFYAVRPDGTEPGFDFAGNIALALAVCEYLGVERETALAGMRGCRRDPYALSLHRLGEALFVNGLSVNDPQSTCMVWKKVKEERGLEDRELILLVNDRPDRGERTEDMLAVCQVLMPAQVWLMGAHRGYMHRKIAKKLPGTRVRELRGAEELDIPALCENQVVYAVGNVAGGGRELMERVRTEGTALV